MDNTLVVLENGLVEPKKVSRELTTKRGIYDKEIEIYIDGEWVKTYLSSLRPGDFWQLLDSNGNPDLRHCYQCVTAPRWSSRSINPECVLGVNNILQAGQLDEMLRKMKQDRPAPEALPAPVKQLPNKVNMDVEDVEFTQIEKE